MKRDKPQTGPVRFLCKSFMFFFFAVFLAACGGGGDGGGGDGGGKNGNPPDDVGQAILKQGVFIDAPVEGFRFDTTTQSGFTDSNGTFNYLDGEWVSFFIGDIFIGQAPGKPVLTPIDLVFGADDELDPHVTNIFRFVQTLDADNDSSNGIRITAEVSARAAGMTIDFDVSIQTFENDVNVLAIIADLTSVLGSPRSLVPTAVAQAHMRNSLGIVRNAVKISGGVSYNCALLSDGTVRCWGLNSAGQLGNGTLVDYSTPVLVTGITTATAISAGGSHTCAVLSDGTIRFWGGNWNGELGDGTTTHSSTPVTLNPSLSLTWIKSCKNKYL